MADSAGRKRRKSQFVPSADPWMTLTDAARALGRTLPTIHAMISRGEIVSGRSAGRLVVARDSVNAALRAPRAVKVGAA